MQGPLGFLKNSDLEGLFPLKRFEVNAAVTLSLACFGTKRGPQLQPDLLLRPLLFPYRSEREADVFSEQGGF